MADAQKVLGAGLAPVLAPSCNIIAQLDTGSPYNAVNYHLRNGPLTGGVSTKLNCRAAASTYKTKMVWCYSRDDSESTILRRGDLSAASTALHSLLEYVPFWQWASAIYFRDAGGAVIDGVPSLLSNDTTIFAGFYPPFYGLGPTLGAWWSYDFQGTRDDHGGSLDSMPWPPDSTWRVRLTMMAIAAPIPLLPSADASRSLAARSCSVEMIANNPPFGPNNFGPQENFFGQGRNGGLGASIFGADDAAGPTGTLYADTPGSPFTLYLLPDLADVTNLPADAHDWADNHPSSVFGRLSYLRPA